jgi:hypothetical protein
MTATPQYVTEAGLDPLAARAIDHVWMHFTRMSGYADGHVPVIVRLSGQPAEMPGMAAASGISEDTLARMSQWCTWVADRR